MARKTEKRAILIPIFNSATDVTTGNDAGDVFFSVPAIFDGWKIIDVAIHVETAGTTGTTDVQIRNFTDSVDVLSTVLTIDSGEKSSRTAATAAVINTSNNTLASADDIRFDVDATATIEALGLTVELIIAAA